MITIKKILTFIICLIIWYLSNLIKIDPTYYTSLRLPFFTPSTILFTFIQTITNIGIAISMYSILTKSKLKDIPKSYKLTLLTNYLFYQSFIPVFFLLKKTFLGFISTLGTFISALFLYEETYNINEKSTKYLDPYVLFSLFTTILVLTIYVLNTL